MATSMMSPQTSGGQGQQPEILVNGTQVGQEEEGKDLEIPDPDPITVELWSCVAVQCILNPDDLKPEFKQGGAQDLQDEKKRTCSYMVPRQGFLFNHLETIRESFSSKVQDDRFVWFSVPFAGPGGVRAAIPWQYPVTVVFDILRIADAVHYKMDAPLYLMANFHQPKDEKPQVLQLNATSTKRDEGIVFFNQMIKEATTLRYGSLAPLLELQKPSYNRYYRDLLAGLKNCDCHQFNRGRGALQRLGEGTQTETKENNFAVVMHYNGEHKRFKIPSTCSLFGQMLAHCIAPLREGGLSSVWNDHIPAKDCYVQGISPLYCTKMDQLIELFGTVDLVLHVVVSSDVEVNRTEEIF